MKFFPQSSLQQLEFDQVKALLVAHCLTDLAKSRAAQLRIHTKKEFVQNELAQSQEFKTILEGGYYFPNEFTQNISRELKLLGIEGASLSGLEFLLILKLLENTRTLVKWFDAERRAAYPAVAALVENVFYEKTIGQQITSVLDDAGIVKDSASEELARIRLDLYRRRADLRRVFDRVISKMNKLGYLADIQESFLNGRRVLAVFAEQKRMVKGVLHGESDSRRTSFIEPEETTDLNNQVFSLEFEEGKEVKRILRQLTQRISIHAPLLQSYYEIAGEFDFIRAKAKLAVDMNASLPLIHNKAILKLVNAVHPLLLLFNKVSGKPTIPMNLTLNEDDRILVISGPNAGGKTVTMKTVGLLQVMMQSGLLVPASPDSEMGIFKQLLIQLGDTQSIEFELSTYSSHLKNMRHFIEVANGKTLFFIDELGSGSDPNLGGAFAEVIMEELAFRRTFGIVTTHYLNLKVMANKVKGIINGAMQFDEKNLLPLYKLQIGQPGSSYTFAIAERIGLNPKLISRARKLVDENHFRLDRLLNSTEQDQQHLEKEAGRLERLIGENEALKKEMIQAIDRESHSKEVEKLKLQNKISEDKLIYLKDMERRLKAMVMEWRKAEDKSSAVKTIQALLFNQKEKMQLEQKQKKSNDNYEDTGGDVKVGDKVRMQQNRKIGIVKELRGKKALLQVGNVPITVELRQLSVVREKTLPGLSENV